MKISEFTAAAVIGLGVLTGIGPAQADPLTPQETDFVHDVHAIGINSTQGDSSLVLGGWAVCGLLNAGQTPASIADQVYQGSQSGGPGGITTSQATQYVQLAKDDLCPGQVA